MLNLILRIWYPNFQIVLTNHPILITSNTIILRKRKDNFYVKENSTTGSRMMSPFRMDSTYEVRKKGIERAQFIEISYNN